MSWFERTLAVTLLRFALDQELIALRIQVRAMLGVEVAGG